MKELLNLYFKPNRFVSNLNYNILFKNSLLLYFTSIIVLSAFSVTFLDHSITSTSPVPNNLDFFLIRTLGLVLKQPIQVLFIAFVTNLLLSVFLKNEITFTLFYKKIFIAFNIIVLSFFVDTINIFISYLWHINVINILKYSLNDLFIRGTDCSQFVTSLLERINPLLILSIMYFYYIIKYHFEESNRKLLFFISLSVVTTLILFSSIPVFLFRVFKAVGTF